MTSSAPVQYILCDFDGTLMDTIPFYGRIRREIVTSHGGNADALTADIRTTRSKPHAEQESLSHILARHCGRLNDVEEVVALQKHIEDTRFPECKPIPYALDLVNSLADCGATLVICSNSTGERLKQGHAHLITLNNGVDPFKFILSASDVSNPKPAPDMYLLAMERLGAKPEECMVLEDSADGATAAIRANTKALMLNTQKYYVPDMPGVTKVKSWKDVSPAKLLAGEYAHHGR